VGSLKLWQVLLLFVVFTLGGIAILLGLMWAASGSAQNPGATTLVAALGGALVASLGAVMTAMLGAVGQRRDTDERIRDEASRVALELTRMDYNLRQQALPEGGRQQFLAPAKVYREFYKAIVQLRTEGTWPQSIEELGLLAIFEVGREPSSSFGTALDPLA
jgi:hypothetical protein